MPTKETRAGGSLTSLTERGGKMESAAERVEVVDYNSNMNYISGLRRTDASIQSAISPPSYIFFFRRKEVCKFRL